MASAREHALVQEALPGYEVGAELGRGAFGIVYVGRHRHLGREVAIKQLPRAFAADPAVRERFVAEAQMVAGLDHPHIVPVYDFVNRDDGICLIIMERCIGALSERFERDGLATDEACAAVLACCAALDFAHARGVLHRDIKPENLLFDGRGVVKLGDFGIARALDASSRRTATGMVVGTPAYMSPEQVRGETLTPASDVYSVGIMAYELLSGSLPFPGVESATGLLAHHLVTPPTPLVATRAELPAQVGAVIDHALTKDVAGRHASAAEFATDLTRACVMSFGAGWLRRRRFVLHWPEVIAESERPRDDGVRTGTIVVKADQLRELLAAAPAAPAEPFASSSEAVAAPPATAPNPPPAPPPSPPVTAPNPTPAPPPASPQAPALGAPALSVPTVMAPAPAQSVPAPTSAARAKGPLVAAAVAGALVLAGLVVLLTRDGGGGAAVETVAATATPVTATGEATGEPAPDVPATSVPATEAPAADDPAAPAPTTSEAPVTEPPGAAAAVEAAPIVVDSPWTPSPCPTGPERVACIIAGVSVDEATGEISAPYQTFGFDPELDPVDFHLHFYLDSVVAGDENKAGAQSPGGGWRIWDGPGPFTSFGGDNGRTGFTVDDARSVDARYLCVLVGTHEHEAIPGTGNCAPLAAVWDPEVVAEQVNRLNGIYAGSCSAGASLILPDGWRWLDLTTTPPADAAAILRPGDVAGTQAILEDLLTAGGVLWADGEVDGDYLVNLNVVRVVGNYTSLDSPEQVQTTLAQSGLTFEGELDQRTFLGRAVNVQVVQFDTHQVTQYVVPDAGYAMVLNFNSPDAGRWRETSDAIAATLLGC